MRHYSSRKRVLVTGGAGFLGSHLCERLLAAGDDVLCADNFFTGTKDNIAHLLASPNFELIRHDVTGPVNVGSPNEFTILQLARQVIDLTGSKSQIVLKPLPSDDPVRRQPDITLAREVLQWSPSTGLDDGLRKPIEYFRARDHAQQGV